MSGCSVVIDKRGSLLLTKSRRLLTYDSKISSPALKKKDSTRQDMGKAVKYTFTSCAVGMEGRRELRFNFKFVKLYSGREASVAHSKFSVAQ